MRAPRLRRPGAGTLQAQALPQLGVAALPSPLPLPSLDGVLPSWPQKLSQEPLERLLAAMSLAPRLTP